MHLNTTNSIPLHKEEEYCSVSISKIDKHSNKYFDVIYLNVLILI